MTSEVPYKSFAGEQPVSKINSQSQLNPCSKLPILIVALELIMIKSDPDFDYLSAKHTYLRSSYVALSSISYYDGDRRYLFK